MRAFLFFRLAIFAAVFLAVLGERAAFSAELQFASGPQRVALIELYSSEGCSSCPPAEKWIGALRTDAGLWRDFVPVAFHVDYWNRLGWTDRFSSSEFTRRQYALAGNWGSGSVYTPCFVRNGVEWRADRGAMIGRREMAGDLRVTLSDERICQIVFSPLSGDALFDVHVAILGGGFVSKVTRGENSGETLPQEFVALTLSERPLVKIDASYRTEITLPVPAIMDGSRRAIAVWITRRGEIASIQATGGWLNY